MQTARRQRYRSAGGGRGWQRHPLAPLRSSSGPPEEAAEAPDYSAEVRDDELELHPLEQIMGVGAHGAYREVREETERLDRTFGFEALRVIRVGGPTAERLGWLVNMVGCLVHDPVRRRPVSGVDLFFVSGDELGGDFRATLVVRPYFYVACEPGTEREVESALQREFIDSIHAIRLVELEDLDVLNHLASQEKRTFLQVETFTTDELVRIRSFVMPYVARARKRARQPLRTVPDADRRGPAPGRVSPFESIVDAREYDVPYVTRVAIDHEVRCGYWYRVQPALEGHSAQLQVVPELVERATPCVLAFDIECTKAPLKFPDAQHDQVMMISWMVDGRGYLGINREVVAADIRDFEYTPRPEYPGEFVVFNEVDERALLLRFFAEVRRARPRVLVTYNGDSFDWPFLQARASRHGLRMLHEAGIAFSGRRGECRGRSAIHMDCLHWVNRDSYLPQGSRGLKAVTRTLLGFEPHELHPEEMVPAARSRPQELAAYSVSDAVCTYYLYMRYVHPFIFSLCNILPLGPDDVLRKGSGTLCENLLMCEARRRHIVAPNKHSGDGEVPLFEDHVLEQETYIGGHVEALRSGVFRSDLPLRFVTCPAALDRLQCELDAVLRFAVEVECRAPLADVLNYDEVRAAIQQRLEALRRRLERDELPLLYHLDVGAMYPNIILTNRLQPHACVTRAHCAACDYNGTSDCQRKMRWVWRGEYYPASGGEVRSVQASVSATLQSRRLRGEAVAPEAASALFKRRLRDYCMRVHRKTLQTAEQTREAWICQRENPFYVDTVRAFRDRRYQYKRLLKRWRGEAAEGDSAEARNMCVLYDSLQLAHKCILNSFYGYVMRRAARWYSMEMAGVVTHTGAHIIRRARELIDDIGVALELDTDGIWCAIPASFPDHYTLQLRDGRQLSFSYLCASINADVARHFTNHQYQDRASDTQRYSVRSECTLSFEMDGPYRAMILPASKEEGKSIKKRYAVFHPDGRLAELKGFELKRRGELKLIKVFQGELFRRFLDGDSIEACYGAVAQTANQWLDVLESRGASLTDAELIDLLAEQNNMSKPLADYLRAGQKSSAITCAKRIEELLGPQMVRDRGLVCQYVIASRPAGAQVTERAIPVQVFSSPPPIRRQRMLRWLREPLFELREVLDWDYYRMRLSSAVQKLITLPAAFQGVRNPVPRVVHPEWMVKRLREAGDAGRQAKITGFFGGGKSESQPPDLEQVPGMEDGWATAGVAVQARASVSRSVVSTTTMTTSTATPAADAALADASETLHPAADYRQWLRRRAKPTWRRWLQQAAQRHDGAPRTRYGAALWSAHPALAQRWHLLAVSAAERPGRYRLWVVLDGQRMLSIPLMVSRRLYFHYRVPPSAPLGQPVAAPLQLPHGETPSSSSLLYGLEMDEEAFRTPAAAAALRAAWLWHGHQMQAVYGVRSSLQLLAHAQLGAACRPLPHLLQRSAADLLRHGVQLDDLERCGEAPMTSVAASMRWYRLYGVWAADASQRGVWCWLTPDSCRVVLVGTRLRRDELVGPVEQAVRPMLTGDLLVSVPVATEVSDDAPRPLQVQLVLCATKAEAYRQLGHAVAAAIPAAGAPRRPAAILLQAPVEERELRRSVPSLNEYPVASVPFAVGDDDRLPPTGWEMVALRRALQRLRSAAITTATSGARQQLSAFANVPICDLPADAPLYAVDVLVARQMLQRQMVPDVAPLTAEDDAAVSAEDDTAPDLEHALEVCHPTVHRGVVLEIDVHDMPLAALLHLESLCAAEGADAPPDPLLTEVLRPLVGQWAAAVQRSPAAALLLAHLHRWLTGGEARLHHSTLQRRFEHLLSKMFWSVQSALQGMNAPVVYASVTRLLLATPHRRLRDALEYGRFMAESLQAQPMFRSMRLCPRAQQREALLWLDRWHYVGCIAAEDTPASDGCATDRWQCRWDAASDLAEPAYQTLLALLVAILSNGAQEAEEATTATRLGTETPGVGGGGGKRARVHAGEPLPPHFLEAALDAVQQVREAQGVEAAQTVAVQVLRVLALEPAWQDTAQSLLHALRKSLGGEVGRQAVASPGSTPAAAAAATALPVVCPACRGLQSVVLTTHRLRECRLLPYHCDSCGQRVPDAVMDAALSQWLQWWVRAYLTRELRCARCGATAARHLSTACECTGAYTVDGRGAPLDPAVLLSALRHCVRQHRLPCLSATLPIPWR